ncbi:MAG: transporter permease protein [Microvirga sp.]|jgi:ABC-type nitrate/sulfonate/bicarbonate transport system permease component|nr:transporter permease protein [Microvirga sp.]
MSANAIAHRVILPLVGVVIVLLIWQATIAAYNLPRIVLPAPVEVGYTLLRLFGNTSFWRDVSVSIKEFLMGYAIGGVLGIAVGALIGERPTMRMLAGPVLESLRFIVPFAWIPLTVLWFGTSLTGKVVLVAYAVFFVMVVTTARALSTVDPTLSRVGLMLGMPPWTIALRINLRAAAPAIASGAKAAAAVGWIAVVAAEYIGASAGLGVMITNASMSLDTSTVIAGMVVIGVIGAAVSWIVGEIAEFWFE